MTEPNEKSILKQLLDWREKRIENHAPNWYIAKETRWNKKLAERDASRSLKKHAGDLTEAKIREAMRAGGGGKSLQQISDEIKAILEEGDKVLATVKTPQQREAVERAINTKIEMVTRPD